MNQVFGKMKVEGKGEEMHHCSIAGICSGKKRKSARMEEEENYPAASKLESTVEKERK